MLTRPACSRGVSAHMHSKHQWMPFLTRAMSSWRTCWRLTTWPRCFAVLQCLLRTLAKLHLLCTMMARLPMWNHCMQRIACSVEGSLSWSFQVIPALMAAG